MSSDFDPVQIKARELLAERVGRRPVVPPSDELLREVLAEAERLVADESADS